MYDSIIMLTQKKESVMKNKYEIYEQQIAAMKKEEEEYMNTPNWIKKIQKMKYDLKQSIRYHLQTEKFRPIDWLGRMYDAIFFKYNVVKVRTLEPTWNDRDNLLLHAMFQILVDFVELEEPFKRVDYEWSMEYRNLKEEILELYHWWKTDPLAMDDDILYADDIKWYDLREANNEYWIRKSFELYRNNIWNPIADAIFDPPKSSDFGVDWPMVYKIEYTAELKRTEMLKRLIDIRRGLWT